MAECFHLLILFAPWFFPNQVDVNQAIERMQVKYRSARTLQATFLERYIESGRVERSEAGIAYFKRPGKMRWEYESPEKNMFLVDGKTVWFYVPADHSATRVPARKSGDLRTPLALLAGDVKVSRLCAHVAAAKTLQPQTSDNSVIYCAFRRETSAKPQEKSKDSSSQEADSGEGAFLEVVRATGELVRILVHESAGVDVEFRFSHWLIDPPLADSLFRFDVPKGVAIVDGELPETNEQRN